MKNFLIKKILVPMDFTKQAYNALETAIALALRHGASITLIQVINNTKVVIPPFRNAVLVPVVQLSTLAAENLSVLSRAVTSKHGVAVTYVIEAGVPAHTICTYAERIKCDLIIVGVKNAFDLKTFFGETMAYKLIKRAPCPVLSIPGRNTFTSFKKIVFPVRSGPKMLDKYEVVRPLLNDGYSSFFLAGLVGVNDADGMRQIRFKMNKLRSRLKLDRIQYTSKIHFCRKMSDRVLKISRSENPDLIVITAMMDRAIGSLLSNYYAKTIVNKSLWPVLSIRPDMELIN